MINLAHIILRSSLSSSSSKTSTSTSPSATSTGPVIKSHITAGNWTYNGCHTEATSTRALNSLHYVNYTSMTLELCAITCKGYKFFGVEYGGECYCGNSFQAGSTVVGDSDCGFACPGDKREFCGAGNRLSCFVAG